MNRRVIIEGDMVHHVGYRPFLLAEAVEVGLMNFESKNVEENKTQKVIVSIGGDENQIKEFTDFVKKNYPKNAKVTKILEDATPPKRVMSIKDYQGVLSAEQQNTIVQTGLIMLNKQDKMLGKHDETIKVLGGKIDNVGSKVEALKTETSQDFNRMDIKYDDVSKKMDDMDHTIERSIKELASAILKLAEVAAKR